jgi:hypothetical protein
MCGEDAPDHIFIDFDSERFVDLLRDPWTSKPWVAPFQFNDGLDEFRRWAVRGWFSFAAR